MNVLPSFIRMYRRVIDWNNNPVSSPIGGISMLPCSEEHKFQFGTKEGRVFFIAKKDDPMKHWSSHTIFEILQILESQLRPNDGFYFAIDEDMVKAKAIIEVQGKLFKEDE